jgi:hypothetical protein
MGDVGVDSRWSIYGDFQEYLEDAYPLVYDSDPRLYCVCHLTRFQPFFTQIDESEHLRAYLRMERILFRFEAHLVGSPSRFVRS